MKFKVESFLLILSTYVVDIVKSFLITAGFFLLLGVSAFVVEWVITIFGSIAIIWICLFILVWIGVYGTIAEW